MFWCSDEHFEDLMRNPLEHMFEVFVLLATLYAAAQVAIPWGDDTAGPLANIPMGAWSSTPWTSPS
jgi:hypothetical protein